MQYKLLISYDGGAFFGWQKIKEGPSIEASLQAALQKVTQEEVLLHAASRTDRGVHAMGQVVTFSLKKEKQINFKRALNAHLPPSIRVVQCHLASPSFHPTLHAKRKEYHYQLCLNDVQDPMHRSYSWHFFYPLDKNKMEKAAQDLLGTHDFSAFANAKKRDPFCTLSAITISPLEGNRLQIAIIGNRFLYKMARNIVGTLLYIGCGKLPSDSVKNILNSKKRVFAGMTAPAHGLTLYRVFYPDIE